MLSLVRRPRLTLLGALVALTTLLSVASAGLVQAAPATSVKHTPNGGVKVTTKTKHGTLVAGWRPHAVRPNSASGCNRDVCIDVRGSGLHVDWWNTTAFGNAGCIRARYYADGKLFTETAPVCPGTNQPGVYYSYYHYDGKFFNGTHLCNGWDRIRGLPCETVHS